MREEHPFPPSAEPPHGLDASLRSILDHMFEGIQILDFDFRYVFLNTTAARHGRRAREELIGRTIMEAYPGIERSEMFGSLARCMTARAPQQMLNQFTYGTGETAWFDLRISPVPLGILVLSVDISSQKGVEDQLQQAQKMEAIGRLAGGIAHDFNNLLTVIAGTSDLVLEDLPANDRLRDDIEEIRKAAEQAAALTRQLLAFSRKQVLQPEVLDVNEVIARLEKMLRRLIGEDIDLVTKLKPALGRVLFDPGQLEQVIMNLAVNARDAMPRGGKLMIETASPHLDAEYVRMHPDAQPGPHVMIAVTDTGIGMTDVVKARIFEPFFTTKGLGKGTGLGLSTVYGIVKQGGGNIWVYSEPERGTVFKVYVPVAAGDAAPSPRPPKEPAMAGGAETILLVEDDAAVRSLIGRMLRRAGYTVLDTGDADEAVELCGNHEGRIHLLLTDVVMPKAGGREVAQRALALRPELKVLYMSGYTDDAIVHHGVLEPGMAFIEKPLAIEALLAKVREVL